MFLIFSKRPACNSWMNPIYFGFWPQSLRGHSDMASEDFPRYCPYSNYTILEFTVISRLLQSASVRRGQVHLPGKELRSLRYHRSTHCARVLSVAREIGLYLPNFLIGVRRIVSEDSRNLDFFFRFIFPPYVLSHAYRILNDGFSFP